MGHVVVQEPGDREPFVEVGVEPTLGESDDRGRDGRVDLVHDGAELGAAGGGRPLGGARLPAVRRGEGGRVLEELRRLDAVDVVVLVDLLGLDELGVLDLAVDLERVGEALEPAHGTTPPPVCRRGLLRPHANWSAGRHRWEC